MGTIIGVIVIIAAIYSSAAKSRKKKRPGQSARPGASARSVSKAARPERPKPIRQPEPRTVVPPPDMTPEAMRPEDMTPETLYSELMTPESMRPEPMTSAEGASIVDAAGCVGGSLPHDESQHQGAEFHAPGTHGGRLRDRSEPQPEAARAAISVEQLRNAVIWSEILDKPVSMRDPGAF